MKYSSLLIFWISISLFTVGCDSDVTESKVIEIEEKDETYPKLKFNKVEHDFGIIKQGDIVKETFRFTNVGSVPFIITNAKTTCGCTVPKYPKNTPIPSQETGEIIVQFDTKGKLGQQNKAITLFSNVKGGKTVLKIYANVELATENQ